MERGEGGLAAAPRAMGRCKEGPVAGRGAEHALTLFPRCAAEEAQWVGEIAGSRQSQILGCRCPSSEQGDIQVAFRGITSQVASDTVPGGTTPAPEQQHQ